MDTFWDTSWANVNTNRIMEYVNSLDMKQDELIHIMRQNNVHTVCDAGCGCGIYILKLVLNGFEVSGFDVSSYAVEIARKLLNKASAKADLKTASIISTEYKDNQFDCVISRDVLDHISKKDAIQAVEELCRITKENGMILLTLDYPDDEYLTEPHDINIDNDYIYTKGKWEGMIFHSYNKDSVNEIIPSDIKYDIIELQDKLIIYIKKTK